MIVQYEIQETTLYRIYMDRMDFQHNLSKSTVVTAPQFPKQNSVTFTNGKLTN
jgi:hypothetical protein